MDLGIEGKVAAVGGASTGLGKAIAWSLAREGARVAVCARGVEQLERSALALRRASGSEIFAFPGANITGYCEARVSTTLATTPVRS